MRIGEIRTEWRKGFHRRPYRPLKRRSISKSDETRNRAAKTLGSEVTILGKNIKFRQANKNEQVEFWISGDRDLFKALEQTYKVRQVGELKLADSPNLLAASAVNLISFIQANGLDKYPNIKINIRHEKNKSQYATLTCRNQDGNIVYALDGIKDLPNSKLPSSSFGIFLDKLGRLDIKLFSPSSQASLFVRRDGSYTTYMCEPEELSNKANLKFLQEFIQSKRREWLQVKANEYSQRIKNLAIGDNPELKYSNPDDDYEELDFLSTDIGTLLNNVFKHGFINKTQSTDEIALCANFLITIVNELKDSINELEFEGYKLGYENFLDHEIYSIARNGKKIEVEHKFDNSMEFRLSLFGQVTQRVDFAKINPSAGFKF